jgi:Leucine-rich repeat (LRR) protein
MEALPESIGNIASLLGLQLQYTNIAKLPDSIGNLANLEYLGVYSYPNDMPWDYHFDNPPDYYEDEKTEKRSPFAVLPDTAANLASLKFLKLSNSALQSLPDFVGRLPLLEKIEIIGCDVKTIPPSIQRLVDNGELTLFMTDKQFNRHQWAPLGREKPRKP